jgi:hypothetical protein
MEPPIAKLTVNWQKFDDTLPVSSAQLKAGKQM